MRNPKSLNEAIRYWKADVLNYISEARNNEVFSSFVVVVALAVSFTSFAITANYWFKNDTGFIETCIAFISVLLTISLLLIDTLLLPITILLPSMIYTGMRNQLQENWVKREHRRREQRQQDLSFEVPFTRFAIASAIFTSPFAVIAFLLLYLPLATVTNMHPITANALFSSNREDPRPNPDTQKPTPQDYRSYLLPARCSL